jgi:site-specific recombinase XerD
VYSWYNVDLEGDGLADYEAISTYFDANDGRQSSDALDLQRRALRYFLVEMLPELTPEEVTPQHVSAFLDDLDERGLATSSRRRYLKVLSAFYN